MSSLAKLDLTGRRGAGGEHHIKPLVGDVAAFLFLPEPRYMSSAAEICLEAVQESANQVAHVLKQAKTFNEQVKKQRKRYKLGQRKEQIMPD